MNIGKNIRYKRNELNSTQKELFILLNITPKMVSFYELGERIPPLDMLLIHARVFQISLDEIVGYYLTNNCNAMRDLKDESEHLLLSLFRKLSPSSQDDCLKYLEFSLSKEQSIEKRKIT